MSDRLAEIAAGAAPARLRDDVVIAFPTAPVHVSADTIIRAALADSIRLSMLLAAALALGGALCAAVTMGPSRRKP